MLTIVARPFQGRDGAQMSSNCSRVPTLLTLTLIVLAASAPVYAQGYGLYEQSVCAMGRGGAGVASPCDDGSAMFFNPAGLALDSRTIASAGVTIVSPRGQFTDSTTQLVSSLSDKTYIPPAAYFATPLGARTMVGIGLFAPYGLGVDWPTTSQGRYVSYKSSAHSFYVQPTVAFRVNARLFVGGGLDITHTSFELRRRVDLAPLQVTGAPTGVTFQALGVPVGTDFADFDLNGSGTHAGVHVGILARATDRVSIGARYLTRQTVSFDNGTITTAQIPTGLVLHVPGVPVPVAVDPLVAPSFAAGAPLSSQAATTSLPLPDQLVLGVAWRPNDRWRVMADYQYTHWSLLDVITVRAQYAPDTVYVENFDDTHGIRVGAEYSLPRVTLRAGFDGHGPAAPDESVTPLLPEAARREIAAGITLPFSGSTRLDFAYMYADQSDRAGRTVAGGLSPTTALNNGTYHYYANLFAASIVVHF